MGLGAAVFDRRDFVERADVAPIVPPMIAYGVSGWVVPSVTVAALFLLVTIICAAGAENAVVVAVHIVAIADQDLDVLPVCIFPVSHIEPEFVGAYVRGA